MIKPILSLLLCISISACAQEKTTSNKDQEFLKFLENTLENDIVINENRTLFQKESKTYWKQNQLDYNLHPEKYKKTIALFHENQQKFQQKSKEVDLIKKERFENTIKSFQNFDDRNTIAKNAVLFIGSSSIAGWKTSLSFPEFPIINRGIGGINMDEILYYYKVLIKKHSPSIIAIYCDIGIEQGKSVNEAVNAFKVLTNKIKTDLPETSILLLSMKPVLIDDFIGKDIRKNKIATNKQLLEFSLTEKNVHFVDLATPMHKPDGKLKTDIFVEDGMHLNKEGYAIWNPIIREKIIELTK